VATTVVFSSGPFSSDLARRALRGHVPDRVVVADGGLATCVAAGLTADVVVGDMDSVDPIQLAAAERSGAQIMRHPQDKDATDLELALELALDPAPDRLVVVGSASGRLDHLLAWAVLVGSPRLADLVVEAWMGDTCVLPVHAGAPRRVLGSRGGVVTLLALHGPATGVHTDGLRWPLGGEVLEPGSTRGVSNQFTDTEARVAVGSGVVTVVVPDADGQKSDGATA